MIDFSILEKLKEQIKEEHKKAMAMVPESERPALQAQLDAMINKANEDSGNNKIMKDFTNEIYG